MNKAVLVVALSSALAACGGSGGSGSKDGAVVLPPVEAKAAKLDQETSDHFASAALYDHEIRELVRYYFNMNTTARSSTTQACELGGEYKETSEMNGDKEIYTIQYVECKSSVVFSDAVIITNGAVKVTTEDKDKDGGLDHIVGNYLDLRVWAEDPNHGVNATTQGSITFTKQSDNLYVEQANVQVVNHVTNATIAKENLSLTFDSSYSDMVPVAASGKLINSQYGAVTLGIDPETNGVTFTGDNSKLTVTRGDSLYSEVSLELDTDNDGLVDHSGWSTSMSEGDAIWSY